MNPDLCVYHGRGEATSTSDEMTMGIDNCRLSAHCRPKVANLGSLCRSAVQSSSIGGKTHLR